MTRKEFAASSIDLENRLGEKGISLEPFFEISADVLCIAGFDGYFKRVNPAFERLIGYPSEELYSRPINDFIHEEDKGITESHREQIRQNKPLLNFENRYVKKSGEVFWLSWTSIPLYNEKLVYAIAKDVTHLKKLEEERNQLLAQLSRVNRKMKLLSYSTSHDLRSPVASFEMVFDLLDMSKIDDEETRDILGTMHVATQNLKKTLNNYLDVLGHEDDPELQMEDLDLKEIFRQVTRSVDSLIKSSQATFEVNFSAFDKIRFSKLYLESTFLNLITNSIKYAQPGVQPEISIKTQLYKGVRQLVFSDNGRGFDAALVKDKMFGLGQKFTDQKDSKGIGLYLVHNNIQSLGGKIDVESEPGKGATFTVSFKG